MRKVFNFSPGPAMLPEAVLLRAQAELLDWNGTGMSVMEIGHRGELFTDLVRQIEIDMRTLLNVPMNYEVLFLPGGASMQFSLIPLNLLGNKKTADYVDTGIWSKKAIEEGRRYGDMKIATATVMKNGLFCIPAQQEWQLNPDAAWLHYTPNETIEGVEFHWMPDAGEVPLIADMTSCIMSYPIDVTRFGMIYAGAQKNLGQAGLSLVIIRNDLLDRAVSATPTLLNYAVQAENHSLYNTPPTYAWYITGLMLTWIREQGGLIAMEKNSRRKSEMLYRFIDEHSDFYVNRVHPSCRSRMNIPFSLVDESLTGAFLAGAEKAGLTYLKGHRLAGGVRASIYNAMPDEGVAALIEFMKVFMSMSTARV